MPITQNRTVLGITAAVILAALVIAGCGRRDLPAEAAAGADGAAGPTLVATHPAAPTPVAPTPAAVSPASQSRRSLPPRRRPGRSRQARRTAPSRSPRRT